MHVSENKKNLIHYLCQCLTVACGELPHTHTKRIHGLVGSGNEEILKITHNGIEKARDLISSHEESDIKIIIFHAVSSDKLLRNQIEMGV